MTILKDPVRPFDPSARLDIVETDRETDTHSQRPEALGDLGGRPLPPHVPAGRTSFEIASPGGYVRTVTGTVAYLDEEAETYMVLRGNGDRQLLRVPLRDITSAHEAATDGRSDAGRDAEGLGTGEHRTSRGDRPRSSLS